MEIFLGILDAFAAVPLWIPFLLLPSLFLLYVAAAVLVGGRGAYPYVAAAGCALSFLLLAARGTTAACADCCLFALYAAALRPLLLIPKPDFSALKRVRREERIYRKFRDPLGSPGTEKTPPKVCKFEEEVSVGSPEACGMRLSHAEEMLAKLKKAPLTAADRLEVDTLSRTVASCRGRSLTEDALRLLNDCLASVLKLLAKYKL